MLSSVRPAIKNGATHVTLVVLAKRAEEVDQFMEKLDATGVFEDVVPATQERLESGLLRVVIESIYAGAEVDEPAAATKKPAGATPGSPAKPGRTGGAR